MRRNQIYSAHPWLPLAAIAFFCGSMCFLLVNHSNTWWLTDLCRILYTSVLVYSSLFPENWWLA
jgi:hypothetical protein